MSTILEEIFKKTMNIENKFKKKKILFIPSESYDGCTITIIEGLNKLGFEILVYKKSNINSWFCNQIINSLEHIEKQIDFVISNLHWGTQWSLYKVLKHTVPYILIDGDDHNNCVSWIDKYKKYINSYKANLSNEEKILSLQQVRWMENIPKNYKPDLIFTSQKFSTEGIYLPFGINNSYLKFNEKKTTKNKTIDISHFPGPGIHRTHMTRVIDNNFKVYNVVNKKVYGEMDVHHIIKDNCLKDKNIHSWHRWKTCKEYFKTINNSKICIYETAPGGWDSKRPWEILSQGTLLLFNKPNNFIDQDYSITNINPFCEFKSINDMINKCNILLSNPKDLEKMRIKMHMNAMRYFTSEPLARYFLWNILN